MDAELNVLDKAIEELKLAQQAIAKHKDRPNMVYLRTAYESANNARKALGESLKEFKSC